MQRVVLYLAETEEDRIKLDKMDDMYPIVRLQLDPCNPYHTDVYTYEETVDALNNIITAVRAEEYET